MGPDGKTIVVTGAGSGIGVDGRRASLDGTAASDRLTHKRWPVFLSVDNAHSAARQPV